MISDSETLTSSLEGILGIRRQGVKERQWAELRHLLEVFRKEALAADADNPGAAAEVRSRLGPILLKTIETNPAAEPAGLCLSSLLSLGHFGAVLVLRLLRQGTVPLDAAFATLAQAPSGAILTFLSRYFLAPRERSDPLHAMARDALAAVDSLGPFAAGRFLAQSAQEQPPPAFAVGDRLLAGPFGTTARKLLAQARPATDLESVILALAALREPGLSELLVDHLRPETEPRLLVLVMEAVGRVLGFPAWKLVKAVTRLLNHDAPEVRLAALDTLAKLHVPGLGTALAEKAKDQAVAEAVLVRLPLLGLEGLDSFLKHSDGAGREAAVRVLFGLLAHLDRDRLERILSLLRNGGALTGGQADELLALLPPRNEVAIPEPTAEEILPAAAPELPRPRRKGGLLSLFSRGGEAVCPDAPGIFRECMAGGSLRGDILSRRHISGAVFEDVVFDHVSLDGSYIENGRFRRCTFRSTRLRGTVIKDTAFEGCVFEETDFTAARLFRCSFREARFEACALSRVEASDTTFGETDFRDSTLHSAILASPILTCCRFLACDLGRLRLVRAICQGLDLDDCTLDSARLESSVLRSVEVRGTVLRDCLLADLETDAPVLVEAARESLLDRLRDVSDKFRDITPQASGPLLQAMAKVVRRLAAERDLERRRDVFLADRDRREGWTEQRIGGRKFDFYRLLPFLLHTEVFDRSTGLYPLAPPCRIAGYHPSYSVLETVRGYFPDATLPEDTPEALPIEAVYTIGSVGSVAMTADSDLDYWVCCKLDEIAEGDLESLSQKLTMLEDWADREFGLEAHFFLMDIRAVRENNFGASDQESSGTAQALMLKEEFYRTALCCAGKKPVWWLAPPGCSEKTYARIAALVDGAKFVDLGHMAAIPAEEFFGASLWQIVKALKSPFKSIMKFGVLEKYTSGPGDGALLCDRIKESLHRGKWEFWSIDPYALMYRENVDYYESAGDETAVRLIKLAFYLKTDLEKISPTLGLPERMEEQALRAALRHRSGPLSFKGLVPADRLSFPDRVELGSQINRFVIDTYGRVRERQKEIKAVRITPEDLTKLGRTLFASFARRKHKIERIPFVSLRERFFKVIIFSASRDRKGMVWKVQGGQPNRSTNRIDLMDLGQGHDLHRLLVWLVANHIYHPEMEISSDFSINPVTCSDLESLLKALYEFFPPKEIFQTAIDETLKEERVTRAFLILNLVVPREQDAVTETAIVYANNWGELFCRTVTVHEVVTASAEEFIRIHVSQACPKGVPLEYFVPDRSRCLGTA